MLSLDELLAIDFKAKNKSISYCKQWVTAMILVLACKEKRALNQYLLAINGTLDELSSEKFTSSTWNEFFNDAKEESQDDLEIKMGEAFTRLEWYLEKDQKGMFNFFTVASVKQSSERIVYEYLEKMPPYGDYLAAGVAFIIDEEKRYRFTLIPRSFSVYAQQDFEC